MLVLLSVESNNVKLIKKKKKNGPTLRKNPKWLMSKSICLVNVFLSDVGNFSVILNNLLNKLFSGSKKKFFKWFFINLEINK